MIRSASSLLLTLLQNLAAETAAYLTTKHPDYAILAARIAISNLHKETKKQFSHVIEDLYNYVNPKNNKPAGMISKEVYDIVKANAETLDSAILYTRDFNYNLCVSARRTFSHTYVPTALASRPWSAHTSSVSTTAWPKDPST